MRRWDGWGSDRVVAFVPAAAKAYLTNVLGPGLTIPKLKFEDVLRRVPPSRLPEHLLVSSDPALRLRHARGQSLPDWVSLRFGTVDTFPDGVSQPESEEEVESILRFATKKGIAVIPYGGGTSVVGHINPLSGKRPVLTINLGKIRKMIHLDEKSRVATIGGGATGPHVEAQLRLHGLTLGHFPQSFEYSSLGGWVATRSSGQQSLYYGRIEDMFAGGMLITPEGRMEMRPFPASAAGPDLRQLVLGSEGRLGVLTKVMVRVKPLPERESFHAVFFPDWEQGMDSVREMAQERIPLSMIRLSNSLETETSLVLAGRERIIRLLNRLLRARGLGEQKCLLIFGVTGKSETTRKIRRQALEIARGSGGVYVGRRMGDEWHKSRFRTPYLRNSLWDLGYAVDTLETAFLWQNLPDATQVIIERLKNGLSEFGEHVLAFAHISHVYVTGASIYVTCLFRLAKTAEETYSRWHRLKEAVSRTIVSLGGTISHQHGVGADHLPYLETEKGEMGMKVLSALGREFDPKGILNPGKLFRGEKR